MADDAVQAGDDSADSPPSDVVLVADSGQEERYLAFRADTREVIWQADLAALDPESCDFDVEDGEVFCIPYELEHRVGPDGLDRLLTIYSPAIIWDAEVLGLLPSVIASIRMTDPPEVEWNVRRLDFSKIDPQLTWWDCGSAEDDPCGLLNPNSSKQYDCTMRGAHDFVVTSADADSMRMVVADTDNQRLLELHVEKGKPCAEVEALYSAENVEGWTVYQTPNSVEAYWERQTLHILATAKDSLWFSDEQGAVQRGKVMHITRDADFDFELAWVFPPADTSAPAFLNSPHNIDVVDSASGHYAFVAHSAGLSDGWYNRDEQNAGRGGVMILGYDDEGASYFLDAHLSGTERRLSYLRDVDLLDERKVLVTDSGCVHPDGCELRPWIGQMDIPALSELGSLELPDRPGHYCADHSSQNLYEVAPSAGYVSEPFEEVGVSVYESDYVFVEDLGDLLGPLVE